MRALCWGIGLAITVGLGASQVAASNNNSADVSDGATLRSYLHTLVAGHQVFPYESSTAFDVHDAIDILDASLSNPGQVALLYSNGLAFKTSWPDYNREHVWPQSLGADESSVAHSDLHHIFACDAGVNSARSNLPFHTCIGECDTAADAPDVNFNGWAWEPPDSHKGDVARALFYMDVRYEGTNGDHDLRLVEGWVEPGCDCMGRLSTLVSWHYQDPPSPEELLRNDLVDALQGNRNPFVDHPEWVDVIWGDAEEPASSGPEAPWINEFHYSNVGKDLNEGVEIMGPVGLNLIGWSLVLYNGKGGKMYGHVELDGVLTDQDSGYGARWFDVPSLQNGGSDGIALVGPYGDVVELLSYEGVFTPTDGPALGRTPIDVGVAQSNQCALGLSLQRVGVGAAVDDFHWSIQSASPGEYNVEQFLTVVTAVEPTVLLLQGVGSQEGSLRERFPGTGDTQKGLEMAGAPWLISGRDGTHREWRNILSFDTTAIPDGAEVVQATLHMPVLGVIGDPWEKNQTCRVGMGLPVIGNSAAVEFSDWHQGEEGATPVTLPETGMQSVSSTALDISLLTGVDQSARLQLNLHFRLKHKRQRSVDVVIFGSSNHPDPSMHPWIEVVYQ